MKILSNEIRMNLKLGTFCFVANLLVAFCEGGNVNRSMTACDCRVPYCDFLPTTPRPDCPTATPPTCTEPTTPPTCPPCECPTPPVTTTRPTTVFTCPPCPTHTTEPPRTTTQCPSNEETPIFTQPIYQSSLPTWPIAGTTIRLGIHANTTDGAPLKYELLTSFEFMTLTTEQNIIFTSNVGEGAFVGPNNVMVIEVTATVIGDEERISSAAVVIIFPRSTSSRTNAVAPCWTDWTTETTEIYTEPATTPTEPQSTSTEPETTATETAVTTPTEPETSPSLPPVTTPTEPETNPTSPTVTTPTEPETTPTSPTVTTPTEPETSTAPTTEEPTTTPEPTFEYCCWVCHGGPPTATTCDYVTSEPCPTAPPSPTCPACTCPPMPTTVSTTSTTAWPTTCSCPVPTTTTTTSQPCPAYENNPTFTKSIYQSSLPTWPIAGTTIRLGIHANTSDDAPIRYELLTSFEFLTLTAEQNIIFTSNVGDGAFVGPNNVMVIEIVATVIGNEKRMGSSAVIIVFPRSTVDTMTNK